MRDLQLSNSFVVKQVGDLKVILSLTQREYHRICIGFLLDLIHVIDVSIFGSFVNNYWICFESVQSALLIRENATSESHQSKVLFFNFLSLKETVSVDLERENDFCLFSGFVAEIGF